MKKWIIGVILLFVFVSGGFYLQHMRSQEEGVLIKAVDNLNHGDSVANNKSVFF